MKKSWYARAIFVALLWIASGAVLSGLLPEQYRPSWLSWANKRKITLGLDLQGGVRLVYTVDVTRAFSDKRSKLAKDMVEMLKTDKNVKNVSFKKAGETEFLLQFDSAEDMDRVDNDLKKFYTGVLTEIGRSKGDKTIHFGLTDREREYIENTSYEQAIRTISNRIDGLGIKETGVTQRGSDVSIEIPGDVEEELERIKRIVSQTAHLEFKIVDDAGSKLFLDMAKKIPEGSDIKLMKEEASTSKGRVTSYYLEANSTPERSGRDILKRFLADKTIPEDRLVDFGSYPDTDKEGRALPTMIWRTWYLHAETKLSGEYIEDARVANDPDTSKPYVSLNFNPSGAAIFDKLTGDNVNNRMGIVLDDFVDSAPVIEERIGGGRARISLGGYKEYQSLLKDASDLVVVLKAGSLPAPISMASETIIGKALGGDAIRKGIMAVLLGSLLVLLFMPIYYKGAGLIANIALIINIMLMLTAMSIPQATLTLPGIAGIVLTVGMAVDANVIIYERIREELRSGKSPRAAVETGFGRAFWTIFDAQITTFIAGVVLLQYGSGPIKGFAVTLLIGIITSMFSGIFITRIIFDYITGRRKAVKHLSI
ncbi:MAG: protein translocase subunit SecD [Pseudomonadota bacterium]